MSQQRNKIKTTKTEDINNQIEILELKNTKTDIKISMDGFNENGRDRGKKSVSMKIKQYKS